MNLPSIYITKDNRTDVISYSMTFYNRLRLYSFAAVLKGVHSRYSLSMESAKSALFAETYGEKGDR